jgi:pimeloyl-ACP methyl ester carboxylesterase
MADGSLVALVHGIWMTGVEMTVLANNLSSAGFHPVRFRYRSLARSPAENAEHLNDFIASLGAERVHLVGHSLGGVVILHLFDRFPRQPPGRVVLLGSPVQGSVVARRLAAHRGSRWLVGRSGERGLLGGVPAWRGERALGVVAGTWAVGVGRMVGGLEGPNDGTVTVSETLLPGAADRLEVHASHMSLVFDRDVAERVRVFLERGEFGPVPD